MPPLRSRRPARPRPAPAPDPPRRSALRLQPGQMAAPPVSAGTVAVSSGGCCSRRGRQDARRGCRQGRGGLATRGSARIPRACHALPWSKPAGLLGRHLKPAERASGQPPGGAEWQPPAGPARAQHRCASAQCALEPARPAICLRGPPAGPVCRAFRHLHNISRDQLIGFRVGGRLAKVVAKAFWSGMTRGKRTGGEWTAASVPMPAQPRGSLCTSSHTHIWICAPRREAPAAGCGAHRGGC
jgi:hypothetical protein